MKKNQVPFAMLGVVLIAAYLFFGCEGPAGAPGKDGQDGVSSVFNLEGFAPDIKCGTCHTPGQDTTNFVAGRKYQWAQSKHALGGDIERNGPDCAACHTTEGFLQRWSGQTVTAQLRPSPPGCFACHSPHARGNFSLRDSTPVTIASFIAGVPDAQFDYGRGNLCVRCHQTRTYSPMSPKPDPTKTAVTDTISITSSRWYPHYGVQGQMLMGKGGFEFQGYTYRGNSNHTTNATIKGKGCPLCHMPEQSYPPSSGTGKAGGHTMNIRYYSEAGDTLFHLVGCNVTGCHGGQITTTSYKAAQKPIEDSLHVLETLLIGKGWLTSSLLVNASSSRPLKIAPAYKAGALYNYYFVEHEQSKGIHNTKYAQDILNSSLQALRTP